MIISVETDSLTAESSDKKDEQIEQLKVHPGYQTDLIYINEEI